MARCRSCNEVLRDIRLAAGAATGLRWSEVDLGRRTATLADTKTGRSIRPLSVAACDVLRGLACTRDLVFPASRGAGCMTGFRSMFNCIAVIGGLPVATRTMTTLLQNIKLPSAERCEDIAKPIAAVGLITPHALRHSLASLAGDLGFPIGSLIGHKKHSVTSRYMHSADAVLLAAVDVVAHRTIEEYLRGRCVSHYIIDYCGSDVEVADPSSGSVTVGQ